MTIKEKFMNEIMENQFKNMTSEEKKQMMESMMEKFFSSMSDDEKKDLMSGMMGKMMGNNPMMGMMSMMMGRKGQKPEKGDDQGKMPWDMCCEMMTGMKETANTAKFATSELRGLFDEWCQQIEKELLDFIKEKGSIKVPEIAEKFGLSEESIKYLLSRLANKNLIDYKA
ncbi:MAG: winged helix-turn-helix domain-containing protein [Bacteroidales bacterium]|nr:winged helix-turn-helix domain-containing protein [Bacteroidales bacterium]